MRVDSFGDAKIESEKLGFVSVSVGGIKYKQYFDIDGAEVVAAVSNDDLRTILKDTKGMYTYPVLLGECYKMMQNKLVDPEMVKNSWVYNLQTGILARFLTDDERQSAKN